MRVVNIIKQRCCLRLLFVFLVSFILLSPQVQASAKDTNSSLEFLDDGTLTLNAEGVPLGTLLRKIQEKTSLEFKIHENLLKQPVSVGFQSLPLNEAIRRILRGVSYSCIFDSSGNVEKIITLPNAGKDKDNSIARRVPRVGLSHERPMQIPPPPALVEIEEAMGNRPSPQAEDIEEAIKAGGGPAPPELEESVEATESMPSPEEKDIEEALGNMPEHKVDDLIQAVKAAGGPPPPEL